jgi:hypothetical protein
MKAHIYTLNSTLSNLTAITFEVFDDGPQVRVCLPAFRVFFLIRGEGESGIQDFVVCHGRRPPLSGWRGVVVRARAGDGCLRSSARCLARSLNTSSLAS